MTSTIAAPAAVPCGFTVVVDTREQLPFTFAGLRAGADRDHAPLSVSVVRATLGAGDYSIAGRTGEIAVERKSGPDLFGTLTRGRERFEAELARLALLDFSAVVVEQDLGDLIANPPTGMKPRPFVASVVALMTRYPTQWAFLPDRRQAEGFCFRLLERWHRDATDRRPAKGRTFALELRDAGGDVEANVRLRRALKRLGRDFGLKCVGIRELEGATTP